MKLPASAILKLVNQECVPQTGNRWLMVVEGDGSSNKVKLARHVISVPLYRGQYRPFPQCWASLCRGFHRNTYRVADLAPIDQARLIHRLSLNRWFAHELKKHPMMKWATSQRIVVDAIAIAQHYGIPTAHVDLTESFAVATFFAACRFSRESQTWEPVTDGTGVIYQVQFNVCDARISPICYQPLPRPSQQWAWTSELRLGEDFLQTPQLQVLEFEHSKTLGEEMLKRFDGGKKLFAADPTARLATRMCNASEMPLMHIEEVEEWLANDPYGLSLEKIKLARTILKSDLNINYSNMSAISYTRHDLGEMESEWSASKDDFWKEVCFRFTRSV